MLLVYPVILFLLLVEFGNSEYDAIFKILLYSLLFFTAYAKYTSFKVFFNKASFKHMFPIYMLMAVFIIATIRTNNQELGLISSSIRFIKLILFFLVTLSFFKELINKNNKNTNIFLLNDKVYSSILVVPVLFICANLILYFIGADPLNNSRRGLDTGNSVLLEYLSGISVQRVNFPLVTTGINNYGIFVGGIISISLTSIWSLKNIYYKSIALLCLTLCIVTLLFLDTRAALVMSIASSLFTILIFKANKIKYAIPVVLIGAAIPLILLLSSTGLLDNPLLSSLSRGDDDFATGNNRLSIWLKVWVELYDIKPIHFLGYGEFGQVGSGLSSSWSSEFSTFYNSAYITTHNVIFQLILDSGYIGLAIFFYFIITTVNRINRTYKLFFDKRLSIFVSFFMYFLLAGGTEAHYTHILSFHLMWYLSIGAFALTWYYVQPLQIFHYKKESSNISSVNSLSEKALSI